MRIVLGLISVALCACGAEPQPTPASCGLLDVAFVPTGPLLQAASSDGRACVRLTREPVDVRRGQTWRASSLVGAADDVTFAFDDPLDLSYENSHHNCLDVVGFRVSGVPAALTLDGATTDPAVCFDDRPTGWVLRMELGEAVWLLAPFVPPLPALSEAR